MSCERELWLGTDHKIVAEAGERNDLLDSRFGIPVPLERKDFIQVATIERAGENQGCNEMRFDGMREYKPKSKECNMDSGVKLA